MKKFLRYILLISLPLLILSCDKEQLDGDPYFILNLIIEDENGKDLTAEIYNRYVNSYLNNAGSTVPYFNIEDCRSPYMELANDSKLINGFICLRDFPRFVPAIYIRLYDDDVESAIFVCHYHEKKISVKWEFDGDMIQQKTKLVTNATLIRHDNGTYSLKH